MTINASKPTVLFAIGEPEDNYTDHKIWYLAKRVAAQLPDYNVVGVTPDEAIAMVGRTNGVNVWLVDLHSNVLDDDQRLLATDDLIRATNDIVVPGTHLSIAKILALDDFSGSFSLIGAEPKEPLQAACVVIPMVGVDNNTKDACGLYGWLAAAAAAQGIPVVSLEVSPLGNKHRFSQLPGEARALKSQAIMRGDVLPREEQYLLRSSQDPFINAYLEHEKEMREMLQVSPSEFVIFIPHHVTFLWDIRRIIEELAGWQNNMCVIVRTDPQTFRRGMSEGQMALRSYEEALKGVGHGVIDERVGVGLLLQLADVVIAPFASTITEQSWLHNIPTIICQPGGMDKAVSDLFIWESRPEQVPFHLSMWRDWGVFQRTQLATIIGRVIHESAR